MTQIYTDITDNKTGQTWRSSVLSVSICALSVIICALTFLVAPSSAKAQTFSLSIYPPLLEVMIMPGKSLNYIYQLSNSGDETTVTTSILPFIPADELGNPQLTINNQQPFGFAQGKSAINFSLENSDISLNQSFTLKQGENKQIILKIDVPEDAPEKDYYYTLLFSTKPDSNLVQTGPKQAGILGSNLLLTISKDGKPNKEGEIVEFSTSRLCLPSSVFGIRLLSSVLCFPLLDSFDKPHFLLRVKNTGRAFWKPFGKISVEGWFGQKEEAELRPDNILANSIRQIEVATPSAFPKSSFLLGKYTAKVDFVPDDSETKLLKTTSFFAFPVKLTIVLLTSVLILFTIKLVIRRRRMRA